MASRAFLPGSPSASAPSTSWPCSLSAVDSPATSCVSSTASVAVSCVASSAMVSLLARGCPVTLAAAGGLDAGKLPGGGVGEPRHVRPQVPVLGEQLPVALLRATGHALDRLGHQARPTAGEVALTRSAHILTGRPTHRLVRQPAPGGTLGRHQSPLRDIHPAAGVDHLRRICAVTDRLSPRIR